MSGDVQPRKRKDKKRRKDEAEQFSIQSTIPILTTNLASDDVNIHVHNEAGTRDGICAKLVFFVLFSALAVLICLIISEHRGMTDVDTVGSESKFSHIFEGWTDANSDNHHGHDEDESLDVDDDEEHEDRKEEEVNSSEEEEDEYIDNKALEEDERDEDTQLSEEKSDERDEELADEDDIEEDVQDSNEYQADEEEDDEVQASDEDADKQTSQEDEQEPYEYEIEEDDENNDEEEDDEDDNNVDEDDNNVDEEDQEVEDNKEDETELNDEEQEFQATGSDEDEGQDENNDIVNNKQDYDVSAENVSREDVTDDDETAQKEEVVTGDSGKDKEPDEDVQESSGMAVKLGVGVALLVVAHLVLVRKWRNAPGDKPRSEEPKDISPDLSRRNTIVVPPTFQEVEPDLEQDEEDYSDEELNEDDGRVATKSAEAKYQELRSTYSRSLSPESQPDQGKYDEEYEENIGDEEDEESSGGDEDEEDFENEEYDDDEDEQLLKRLEAKYGKIHESSKEKSGASWKSNPPNEDEDSDSDRQSDDGVGYENINITNEDDYNIKDEIDEAQKSVKNNSAYAITLFDKLLQTNPSSPRSLYGKALATDYLADQKKSNELLNQALELYTQLLKSKTTPQTLFKMAAERCIERMRFIGQYRNAVIIHQIVNDRFPDNPKYQNDLVVTYLMHNRVEEARSLLKQVLKKWPNDGFALVHYGFIFKTKDNKLEEAVYYMKKGMQTKAEGVVDGRFYFHLGDALARLGRHEEAEEVYEEGAANKVFLSKYQRSLYNVPRLLGKPWWEPEDLPYNDLFRLLKQNWKRIRAEGMSVLNEDNLFKDESENLRDTGEWKQFELYARGHKNAKNCKKCPFTCGIIDQVAEARNCKRGQTKFSIMFPGTHIWPHCGPTNCRLRTHLGLKVPPKTFIRVANEIRTWKEGHVIAFDDSFEHEVWHNGTDFRLVLIVDIWHPELTTTEKKNLSPI